VTAAYNVAGADASGPGGTSIVSVMDFTTIPSIPGADTDVYGFWQAGDLIHPSNRGHQMIADCLTAFLSFS
jgi:phospholipase/lecithinase/hemolysin